MKQFFKGASKSPIRLMPIGILLLILYTAVSLYIANYSRNEMNQQVDTLDRERENMEWSVLEDSILDAYDVGKQNARTLALQVEYSLRTKYPDLDVLEEQFDNNQYSNDFNEVLKDVLYREDKSKSVLTLVGTKEHLITMFSNGDDHLLRNLDSDTIVDWDEVIKVTPNPDVSEKAIDAILSKSTHLVFTVKGKGNEDDIDSMSLESLRKLYYKEGMKGLKNITLLAAAYITESGDIFGTDDTNFLKSNDNHKIIIIEAVDLFDVIINDEQYIKNLLTTVEDIYDLTSSQGDRTLMMAILWTSLTCVLSLYLIMVYNSEEKKGHLYDETDKGGKRRDNER